MTACLTNCGLVFGDGTCQTIAASGAVCVQTFCATGSWTMPPGTQFVEVYAVAGGGGGSGSGRGGSAGNNGPAGAGGSGILAKFPASLITSPVCVVVGAGGAGGQGICTTGYCNGSTGGASCFGSYVYVCGGTSSSAMNPIGSYFGGCALPQEALATSGTPYGNFSGGAGALFQYTVSLGSKNSVYGGAGGGAGGYTDCNVPYTYCMALSSGKSIFAGNGGDGNYFPGVGLNDGQGCKGCAGCFPGGGGGAGTTGTCCSLSCCGGCGGAGGNGRVIVYSW